MFLEIVFLSYIYMCINTCQYRKIFSDGLCVGSSMNFKFAISKVSEIKWSVVYNVQILYMHWKEDNFFNVVFNCCVRVNNYYYLVSILSLQSKVLFDNFLTMFVLS
eukprot:TRINITY_DN5858_c1_g1_i4.p11 TRINITY_DN5858_c1_g1~~TRINITY_DN5858_c1_g1_i4.p11  ORF type:complete len:106 (+),score=1.98 TRINITY_DN5858_c1_g1_i4:1666-1983(+)